MRRIRWAFTFVILFLVQCDSASTFQETSFYYWKTSYELSDSELNYLDGFPTQKIYFKAFDVVDQEPVGVLQWADSLLPNIEYVPTVFIDYEVFQEIKQEDNEQLAENILKLVKGICAHQKIEPQELQIDCDWTRNVQKQYFYFLNYLKKFSQLKISTTIRLHQLKYQSETGVPPCDYGVLMCYNMGDLKSPLAQNSIYNIKILKSYLNDTSYPLRLKAALPIFSWILWYRGEQFMGILPREKYYEFIKVKSAEKDACFVIKEGTEIQEHFFEAGDKIRDETVRQETLVELKDYLSKSKLNLLNEIIYFSLDSANLYQYEKSLFTP